MMLRSMTGFASLAGGAEGMTWAWEARSVNGRGLDLRLRLPEGFEALEPPIRAAASAALARGSISIGLRLARGGGVGLPRLNPAGLDAAIMAAGQAAAAAARQGISLAPINAADLLAMRGVVEPDTALPSENPAVLAALNAQIAPLMTALAQARCEEGAALTRVLGEQIARLAELAARARASAEARATRTGALLRSRVTALLDATEAIEESRLAQELAIIAVKADLTEELDRLDGHVAAALALLETEGPVGRKLDFLTQEFNREANTLCSKAASGELTALGLEIKVVVDQMREQVQNVE